MAYHRHSLVAHWRLLTLSFQLYFLTFRIPHHYPALGTVGPCLKLFSHLTCAEDKHGIDFDCLGSLLLGYEPAGLTVHPPPQK